jgi:HD domain
VDIVAEARQVAEGWLAKALPRRWRHVEGVASAADRVASTVAAGDPSLLVAAAWLHDIGYAPGIDQTGFHPLDGARRLRQHGFDERLAALVANHTCALWEASLRGLADELRAEFPREASAAADALWYADLTTGPDGQAFTVEQRLTEIRARYGPNHLVTRFWIDAEPEALTAVQRVERRLKMIAAQPM